jgi:UDP-N-acetylmuramoylalanine--D-glutamate ligase
VVGLGRSGLAACRLAASKGARVRIADLRREEELGPAAAEARALGAELCAGGHPAELARDRELVIASPGVPLDREVFAEARRLGVPVWAEVELAARFCRGRIVGVTGSNGKSTVTSMTGTILRGAGIPGGTGGNLGTPLTDLLALDGPEAVHVVELSSFQLEAIAELRADVAVIVNLSPDHLDRYASYDDYARAKARLLETQAPTGHAVLNADDPECRRFEAAVRGRLWRFSTRQAVDGACLRGDRLVLRAGGQEQPLLRPSELPVPGEHNLANALAAALACHRIGCEHEAIARGLRAYRALPHRLELVRSVGGVAFYNDSKATNLDAARRALVSFPPSSVHLILGGKDKGADWGTLADPVRRHARRVLLVGQAAPAIRSALAGSAELVDCGTVPAAVRAGYEAAAAGQVVLLSPACASFDQYKNFEARGEDFRRTVAALAPRESDRA